MTTDVETKRSSPRPMGAARFLAISAVTGLAILAVSTTLASKAKAEPAAQPVPASIGKMTMSPDGTLFFGDAKSGRVFAYPMRTAKVSTSKAGVNVHGLDQLIAKAVQVEVSDLRIAGVVVHPTSREMLVGIMFGKADKAQPALLKVSREGKLERLDLGKHAHTSWVLEGMTKDGVTFWGTRDINTLAISAIAFNQGRLYVAGISSAAFSSTVWSSAYPFDGKAATSKVTMYHAVHNQNETRSPIRAMTTMSIGGKDHLLASYLCTPLVTIPLEALIKGGDLKGKTIAELGWGNAPIDLVNFEAQDQKGKHNLVMITNRHRNAMLIDVKDIVAANAKDGMSEPSGFELAGVASKSIPMSGIMHLADYDPQFLLAVRRDLDSGRIDLLTFRKAAYMRISDFVSEYNFPNFSYPKDGSQDYVKGFQDLLKSDEGMSK